MESSFIVRMINRFVARCIQKIMFYLVSMWRVLNLKCFSFKLISTYANTRRIMRWYYSFFLSLKLKSCIFKTLLGNVGFTGCFACAEAFEISTVIFRTIHWILKRCFL